MEGKKWYGLTIPKKEAKVNTKGKSVFESDNSDDNVEDHGRVKKESSSIPKEKKKVGPEPKSEEIDTAIYEYDSIYDEMKASQKQKTTHTKSKEPRYINLLLKAADKRKKESERRVERKIQAERVKEGDAFKDKEAFVTSAYRKKMLEMEEEEERERRESALEEMMDSTKQKDLSGFYRHFLKQTVGEERIPEFGERDGKKDSITQKKEDCSEAEKSKERSESSSRVRSGTVHSSPEKKIDHHSDIRQRAERAHRSDSLNKSDTKESRHSTPCNLDKSRHLESKSSLHRSKGWQQNCSPSDSESRNSKSRYSERKSSHRRQGRQRSYSSSDSEGKNSKSRHSKPKSSSHGSQSRQRSGSSSESEGRSGKPRHSELKSSLHRSQDKQRSCSSSDSEDRNSKSKHSEPKSSSHKSQGRQQSCSSSDSEGKNSKSQHSKSHRSNVRQRSYSSSDSEGRKNKHNTEKSHKRKLDPSTQGSEYVHEKKQKHSRSARNHEEKIYDRTKSDGYSATKHSSSSSERYGSGCSSSKITDQRSQCERDREENKKDVKKERESPQASSQQSSENQGYIDRHFDDKNKECSKHGFNYDHGEVKKHSGSEQRESSVSIDYPESKKRKLDDDDDDDTSHTSSEDEADIPSSSMAEEGKKVPENSKANMVTKFAKRTVGKIFDDAQARYFKRRDAAKAMN